MWETWEKNDLLITGWVLRCWLVSFFSKSWMIYLFIFFKQKYCFVKTALETTLFLWKVLGVLACCLQWVGVAFSPPNKRLQLNRETPKLLSWWLRSDSVKKVGAAIESWLGENTPECDGPNCGYKLWHIIDTNALHWILASLEMIKKTKEVELSSHVTLCEISECECVYLWTHFLAGSSYSLAQQTTWNNAGDSKS